MMDGELARTYTLIHAFLLKHAHIKAARALKKSVKGSLILKDDTILEGPSLDDIIRSWNSRKDQEEAGSSSDSDKQDTQDNESSDSDLSDTNPKTVDSQEPTSSSITLSSNHCSSPKSIEAVKRKHTKPVIASKEKSSKALVASTDGACNQVKAVNKGKGKREVRPCYDSTSLDSDSNSPNKDSDARSKTIPSKAKALSSSSEESNSESQLKEKLKVVKVSSTKKETASTNSKSDLKVENTSTRVTKKRRTDSAEDEGNSVTTAVDVTIPVQAGSQTRVGKDKGARTTTSNRFSRVKSSMVQSESVVDNSYVSKNGPMNDYGKRAHQDLIVTRGVGFRKEKNKKKRGSYRGGEITMESHSFKFTA